MRIAYVCEGAGSLGWGHLMRAYTVWEAASEEVTIVVGRGLDELQSWGEESGLMLSLARWDSKDSPLEPTQARYDAIVVDDYSIDQEWIARVAAVRPTFVVDDWMRQGVRATGIVNPNVGARHEDYSEAIVERRLLGPQFSLIRKEIREAKCSPVNVARASHVLLTLGGSDPDGRTAEIAAALIELPWYEAGGILTVVLGSSYVGNVPWTKWPWSRAGRVEVVRRPKDFVARCCAADLVLSSASTTTYELACLGRPFLPLGLVANQGRISGAWAERGVGRGLCVWQRDWMKILLADVGLLVNDGERRARMAASASSLVDGHGVDRVLRVLRTEGLRHAKDRSSEEAGV